MASAQRRAVGAEASPGEVTLLEQTLASQPIRATPARLIADRSYDSKTGRGWLKRRGIQPIIPVRRNNTQATDQDGRCLRPYRRRWIVERTIGWLGNFRRLTVRYDRLLATYGGFFHLASALLVLREGLNCLRFEMPSRRDASIDVT